MRHLLEGRRLLEGGGAYMWIPKCVALIRVFRLFDAWYLLNNDTTESQKEKKTCFNAHAGGK